MKRVFLLLLGASVFSACTNNAKDEALVKQQVIKQVSDSLKLDSFKRADAERQVQLAEAKEEKIRVAEEKRMLLLSERSEAPRTVVYQSTPVEQKKKGWSEAAKGTAIGAGAGALGGVLIDKKDGRGAIIGGLVGAGTGYLIGRDKDRKSGRVTPKN
jgi:hypothetical protein